MSNCLILLLLASCGNMCGGNNSNGNAFGANSCGCGNNSCGCGNTSCGCGNNSCGCDPNLILGYVLGSCWGNSNQGCGSNQNCGNC